MRTHVALDCLIDLEERAGRLYTQFYQRFSDMSAVAALWWEMALEEHGHAGILKMVKELADPAGRVPDIRARLRPLQRAIHSYEQQAGRDPSLTQALAVAVRLERSELDRLGSETVRAIRGSGVPIPRAAFAPHEAHLERLMRTVRKFGGEEVLREAWTLRPEVRQRTNPPLASALPRGDKGRGGGVHSARGKGRNWRAQESRRTRRGSGRHPAS